MSVLLAGGGLRTRRLTGPAKPCDIWKSLRRNQVSQEKEPSSLPNLPCPLPPCSCASKFWLTAYYSPSPTRSCQVLKRKPAVAVYRIGDQGLVRNTRLVIIPFLSLQVSPCNERAVLNQMREYTEERMAGYATTIEEDNKVVSADSLLTLLFMNCCSLHLRLPQTGSAVLAFADVWT